MYQNVVTHLVSDCYLLLKTIDGLMQLVQMRKFCTFFQMSARDNRMGWGGLIKVNWNMTRDRD